MTRKKVSPEWREIMRKALLEAGLFEPEIDAFGSITLHIADGRVSTAKREFTVK